MSAKGEQIRKLRSWLEEAKAAKDKVQIMWITKELKKAAAFSLTNR